MSTSTVSQSFRGKSTYQVTKLIFTSRTRTNYCFLSSVMWIFICKLFLFTDNSIDCQTDNYSDSCDHHITDRVRLKIIESKKDYHEIHVNVSLITITKIKGKFLIISCFSSIGVPNILPLWYCRGPGKRKPNHLWNTPQTRNMNKHSLWTAENLFSVCQMPIRNTWKPFTERS